MKFKCHNLTVGRLLGVLEPRWFLSSFLKIEVFEVSETTSEQLSFSPQSDYQTNKRITICCTFRQIYRDVFPIEPVNHFTLTGYQTRESHCVVLSNSLSQMFNHPVTQFHHMHQTARYSFSSDCVTVIHVFTPTLSCSVAMTTWRLVFLLIHWHSTVIHKSNSWLSSSKKNFHPNLN